MAIVPPRKSALEVAEPRPMNNNGKPGYHWESYGFVGGVLVQGRVPRHDISLNGALSVQVSPCERPVILAIRTPIGTSASSRREDCRHTGLGDSYTEENGGCRERDASSAEPPL